MYCPQCGAEYRPGFDTCSDCEIPLVDRAPADQVAEVRSPHSKVVPELNRLEVVLVTGRLMDAELARSFLETHEIHAHIWSSGLSPGHVAAALTEVTGVPNDFNAHRVMVAVQLAPEARRLLSQQLATDPDEAQIGPEDHLRD